MFMNLLRKTWGIVIAVIISSCHSATFDTISPDGTLKVGVVTTKDGDYGKAAFVVHYKGDSIFFVPNWDWKQMRKSLPVT